MEWKYQLSLPWMQTEKWSLFISFFSTGPKRQDYRFTQPRTCKFYWVKRGRKTEPSDARRSSGVFLLRFDECWEENVARQLDETEKMADGWQRWVSTYIYTSCMQRWAVLKSFSSTLNYLVECTSHVTFLPLPVLSFCLCFSSLKPKRSQMLQCFSCSSWPLQTRAYIQYVMCENDEAPFLCERLFHPIMTVVCGCHGDTDRGSFRGPLPAGDGPRLDWFHQTGECCSAGPPDWTSTELISHFSCALDQNSPGRRKEGLKHWPQVRARTEAWGLVPSF